MTICFADLDGADGLWVPEERTVLVNRRLSEREVAKVIEHELGHVAIDDQHAELDAGVGRPPPNRSRRWAAALTAAACLAVIGGVSAVLVRGPAAAVREDPVVAPTAPPLTSPARVPAPVVTVVRTIGPDGELVIRTVTLTAPAPVPPSTPAAATPTTSPAAPTTAAPTRAATVPPPARTASTPPPSPTTPSAPATVSSAPPATPTPTPTPDPDPTQSVVAGTDDGTS